MKAYYKLFSFLAVGALITFASCQEDEKLDLVEFPVNQPTITIDGAEGASKAVLKATYNLDGTLTLNGVISRTYTFQFAASPEDATVNFELLATHIPQERAEISATKAILPAGYTEASVTVTLKEEDFSFAAANYEAVTYELGVKATVEGYKIGTEPIESKVVIEKEAYVAFCSVAGESGNKVSFERAYSQGQIVNPDLMSYTFKARLDKPARKDTKIKFTTTGLKEEFVPNVTVTPAEMIIPAGELESGDITWMITDDFLLTTTEEEKHTLVVKASVESEDPVVMVHEKEGLLTFTINKVFRNFGYTPDKVTGWLEWSKTGWSVDLDPSIWGNGNVLIDGRGGTGGSDVYSPSDFWLMLDMKSEKTMTGFGIDYYRNTTASSPKKVQILTSLDKETWVSQGILDTPQAYNQYFQFFTPVHTRYVKVQLMGRYNSYIDLTEIYVYNNE